MGVVYLYHYPSPFQHLSGFEFPLPLNLLPLYFNPLPWWSFALCLCRFLPWTPLRSYSTFSPSSLCLFPPIPLPFSPLISSSAALIPLSGQNCGDTFFFLVIRSVFLSRDNDDDDKDDDDDDDGHDIASISINPSLFKIPCRGEWPKFGHRIYSKIKKVSASERETERVKDFFSVSIAP